MPKPFKVMLEIEEIALGSVFNKLDTMQGVISINMVGSGPKSAGTGIERKRFNGSASQGTTTLCIVLSALQAAKDVGDGTMLRKPLEDIVVAAGKSPKSLASCLSDAKSEAFVRFKGNGEYSITAKGVKYLATSCAITE